jgi:hypothetical protein
MSSEPWHIQHWFRALFAGVFALTIGIIIAVFFSFFAPIKPLTTPIVWTSLFFAGVGAGLISCSRVIRRLENKILGKTT